MPFWSLLHLPYAKSAMPSRRVDTEPRGQEHESQCPKAECCYGVSLIWYKSINECSGRCRRIPRGCICKGQFLYLTTVLKPPQPPLALALLYEKCSNPTKCWYHKSFFLIQFSSIETFSSIRCNFCRVLCWIWVVFADSLSLLSFVHPPTAFIAFMCQINKSTLKSLKH